MDKRMFSYQLIPKSIKINQKQNHICTPPLFGEVLQLINGVQQM